MKLDKKGEKKRESAGVEAGPMPHWPMIRSEGERGKNDGAAKRKKTRKRHKWEN